MAFQKGCNGGSSHGQFSLKIAVTKEFANTMTIEYAKRIGGIQDCM